jgi:hypothetical protein
VLRREVLIIATCTVGLVAVAGVGALAGVSNGALGVGYVTLTLGSIVAAIWSARRWVRDERRRLQALGKRPADRPGSTAPAAPGSKRITSWVLGFTWFVGPPLAVIGGATHSAAVLVGGLALTGVGLTVTWANGPATYLALRRRNRERDAPK